MEARKSNFWTYLFFTLLTIAMLMASSCREDNDDHLYEFDPIDPCVINDSCDN